MAERLIAGAASIGASGLPGWRGSSGRRRSARTFHVLQEFQRGLSVFSCRSVVALVAEKNDHHPNG